jgi:hypothetical protein
MMDDHLYQNDHFPEQIILIHVGHPSVSLARYLVYQSPFQRQLYEYFNQALGQTNILSERLVAMFHRSTADRNKDHVLSEFPRSDSTLRIVFATVAFGMGIDIPDIEQVIHWGAPCGLEQFAQERSALVAFVAVAVIATNVVSCGTIDRNSARFP